LKSGDNQNVTLQSKENTLIIPAKVDQSFISESKYVTNKQGTYRQSLKNKSLFTDFFNKNFLIYIVIRKLT
jgi:hypothetical protein